MKPKRIILIRHGESESNADKNQRAMVPDYAVNLTSKGQKQARQAGKEIREMIGAETLFVYCRHLSDSANLSMYRRKRPSQCVRAFEDRDCASKTGASATPGRG
jgi:bisphosphoglycerate-dependent phosphoglycerate mutase